MLLILGEYLIFAFYVRTRFNVNCFNVFIILQSEDLEYWSVDEVYMDSCCQMKFQQKRDQLHEEIKKGLQTLRNFYKHYRFTKNT